MKFVWFCVELYWMINFVHPFLPPLNSVCTWSRTGSNVYILFLGEAYRFSHRTQIRFSEFSVSFIGSSCSSSHLGLLLFSCCYYFFPIALILFLLLLLFSHGVALSVWWSHLIIKKKLINENFNNQVVKTGCENWLLLYIWEPTYLRTGWVWKK